MSIQHDHKLHPITALIFHSDHDEKLLLLAGEGPFLKIFDVETSNLIHQCQIFNNQSIHGIVVKESVEKDDALQVVIWGGYNVAFLSKRDVSLVTHGNSSLKIITKSVSDWILDVSISPYRDWMCVLVTANNAVLLAQPSASINHIQIDELHSPSKSILYSAHLLWDSIDTILVAAGTVFGEIIAWKCCIPNGSNQSKGQALVTHTGHEGSIFGVAISSIMAKHDGSEGRLVASCSDDRTIRIWDLPSTAPFIDSSSSVIRETGFGDNGQVTVDRCLAVGMGHASRIWRVKFLLKDTESGPLINILSFGEDSTTQQWSLSLDRVSFLRSSNGTPVLGNPGILEHQKTFAFHSGKHIWSTAVGQNSQGLTLLATGGADGKISCFPVAIADGFEVSLPSDTQNPVVEQDLPKHLTRERNWDLTAVLSSFETIGENRNEPLKQEDPLQDDASIDPIEDENPIAILKRKKKAKKIPNDSFNRYSFVKSSQIIVTTTFGRVLMLDFDTTTTWKELFLPASAKDVLKSWSVVKASLAYGIAFLAGTNGNIYAYNGSLQLVEVGKVDSKVADMFIVSYPIKTTNSLLVTNLQSKIFTSFEVQQVGERVTLGSAVQHELPNNFTITSAAYIHDTLVLGARSGSLAMINEQGECLDLGQAAHSLAPDAITSIMAVHNSEEGHQGRYFLTTGRNGKFSIFCLSQTSATSDLAPTTKHTLSLLHQGSPPFGPVIDYAWYNSAGHLLLHGFKSKNFIVWNETQQSEIMSIGCGGAHRSYAYSPTEEGGNFIYTKASRLYLYSQPKASHQIIKPGGHGREIKVCAVSEDERYFATAAEDTTIRIWSYSSSSKTTENAFNCYSVVQKHTTGIQNLQWYKTRYLFSSGGYEEFFIWAITPLPNDEIGIMCEASAPWESEEKDLRIMNFDVTEIPSEEEELQLLISLAYSDSTLRVYSYSKTSGYKTITTGRYTSSCLLQISCLQISMDGFCLLTAATDGNLTLWHGKYSHDSQENSAELVMLSTTKIHQNSIKCLDIGFTRLNDQVLVATGGDDNALAITVYPISTLLHHSARPKIFILRSAHAAAVTGLSFVPIEMVDGALQEECRVVSSSNDQRIKEWSININYENDQEDSTLSNINLSIKKTGDVFTPVADVGDVACLQSGKKSRDQSAEARVAKVLIVGNGMEVWSVATDI